MKQWNEMTDSIHHVYVFIIHCKVVPCMFALYIAKWCTHACCREVWVVHLIHLQKLINHICCLLCAILAHNSIAGRAQEKLSGVSRSAPLSVVSVDTQWIKTNNSCRMKFYWIHSLNCRGAWGTVIHHRVLQSSTPAEEQYTKSLMSPMDSICN